MKKDSAQAPIDFGIDESDMIVMTMAIMMLVLVQATTIKME